MRRVIVVLAVLVVAAVFPVFAGAAEPGEGLSEWTERLAAETPFQSIEISGVIEVEAGYISDFDNNKESDIDLTTVELRLDVGFNDWISGFLQSLWEDDENDFYLEEGGIVLGNLDAMGFSLTAGKFYLPFGTYETNLISDTLTLELGETREGAAVIDVAAGGFYGALYTFNSAVNKVNEDDDMIDAFGATVGYALEADRFSFDVSAGWTSNLTSSDGFSGFLEDNDLDIDDHTRGVAVSALLSAADLTLIGEYIAALDSKYDAASNDKPSAWGLELGYDFELLKRDVNVAVSYQGTDEAAFLGLPESRILAGVSSALTEHLSLALELSKDKDYSAADGGSGNNAEAAVVQLAFEF